MKHFKLFFICFLFSWTIQSAWGQEAKQIKLKRKSFSDYQESARARGASGPGTTLKLGEGTSSLNNLGPQLLRLNVEESEGPAPKEIPFRSGGTKVLTLTKAELESPPYNIDQSKLDEIATDPIMVAVNQVTRTRPDGSQETEVVGVAVVTEITKDGKSGYQIGASLANSWTDKEEIRAFNRMSRTNAKRNSTTSSSIEVQDENGKQVTRYQNPNLNFLQDDYNESNRMSRDSTPKSNVSAMSGSQMTLLTLPEVAQPKSGKWQGLAMGETYRYYLSENANVYRDHKKDTVGVWESFILKLDFNPIALASFGDREIGDAAFSAGDPDATSDTFRFYALYDDGSLTYTRWYRYEVVTWVEETYTEEEPYTYDEWECWMEYDTYEVDEGDYVWDEYYEDWVWEEYMVTYEDEYEVCDWVEYTDTETVEYTELVENTEYFTFWEEVFVGFLPFIENVFGEYEIPQGFAIDKDQNFWLMDSYKDVYKLDNVDLMDPVLDEFTANYIATLFDLQKDTGEVDPDTGEAIFESVIWNDISVQELEDNGPGPLWSLDSEGNVYKSGNPDEEGSFSIEPDRQGDIDDKWESEWNSNPYNPGGGGGGGGGGLC